MPKKNIPNKKKSRPSKQRRGFGTSGITALSKLTPQQVEKAQSLWKTHFELTKDLVEQFSPAIPRDELLSTAHYTIVNCMNSYKGDETNFPP